MKIEITSYNEAAELFHNSRKRKIGCNTCLVEGPIAAGDELAHEWFAVRYHNTNVATFYANGDIELQTDGFETTTTKKRMNEALAATGFRVWQSKFVWYIGDNDVESKFENGMRVRANNPGIIQVPCPPDIGFTHQYIVDMAR